MRETPAGGRVSRRTLLRMCAAAAVPWPPGPRIGEAQCRRVAAGTTIDHGLPGAADLHRGVARAQELTGVRAGSDTGS